MAKEMQGNFQTTHSFGIPLAPTLISRFPINGRSAGLGMAERYWAAHICETAFIWSTKYLLPGMDRLSPRSLHERWHCQLVIRCC